MPLEFRENFQVRAPVERVWQLLLDPAQVVECMPGATLLGADDERTYRGHVTAKVGPITTTYSGRATFVEVDDVAHRARIVGEGKEGAGSGSARMTIIIEVRAGGGGTDVNLSITVDIVGRVMQFGRALLDGVAKQLLRQFAECVRAKVEALEGPGVERIPAQDERPTRAPPVRPLALLFRVIREWIARLFR
jgi:uncharacterized protein